MGRPHHALLRDVLEAVLVAGSGVVSAVGIVVVGLGLLDDAPYAGRATEAAYLAVAAAALAAAGSSVFVGVCFVMRSLVMPDGARRAGSRRTAPDR